MDMIVLDGVSRTYGARAVVDDVSFTVPRGAITAVVGRSGSGKSTLLRMINRLVVPSAGRVLVDGQDVAQAQGPALRRHIGYVIQGVGLFPHWTVRDNVATVPRLLGWAAHDIDRRVNELLELVGLPHQFADRYPRALSGGEQQRVGVARALAAGPPVLLMDEPFGALDPLIRSKAQNDLLALRARLGTTIVLVTHDLDEALRLGDRIAVLEAGRLLQEGAPRDLLRAPASAPVAALVEGNRRALRLLSLLRVGDLAESGPAEEGTHAASTVLAPDATLEEALSALLWSGAASLPVTARPGEPPRRLTREAVLARALGP
jgi:osmoprotectant transport system ATP-binding protein